MPLEMPEMDSRVGTCGMPAIESGEPGMCRGAGVVRVEVQVDDGDNDYEYKYHQEFRAVSFGRVMVDMCQAHKDRVHDDFAKAAARVKAREADLAKGAEEIRDLEERLRVAKARYPGPWRD